MQAAVAEGELLWEPSDSFKQGSRIADYMRWLATHHGRSFDSHEHAYEALWQWSVDDLAGFWSSVWDYFEVPASKPFDAPLGQVAMPGTQWFPGAELNYAEALLRLPGAGDDDVVAGRAGVAHGPLRGRVRPGRLVKRRTPRTNGIGAAAAADVRRGDLGRGGAPRCGTRASVPGRARKDLG